MPSLGEILHRTRSALSAAGVPDAALDARMLVEHFTGTTRTDAIATPDLPVTTGQAAALDKAVGRRASGEPVHRILGFREFYGLRLALSPETLEPRPDTETLVDLVLPHARRLSAEHGRCRILDLGTGTGAIALALLSMLPGATALGVDLSQGALATAVRNADMAGIGDRFRTCVSDWFAAVEDRYDIIVSNPPYVTADEWRHLERGVRDHDPRAALVGGDDGLEAYRAIARSVREHLSPFGLLGVEIGRGQGDAVRTIFAACGFAVTAAGRDLGGHERALLFDARKALE